MEAKKLDNFSIKEYLDLEIETNEKHEFLDGSIYSLAGGTINHGRISGNIFAELHVNLKGSKCNPINSDVKVYVESVNSFFYPDAMVICDEIETSSKDSNSITNPKVIIEVLSKSTASYDRGDKFFLYRQLESLEEYILIDQYKAQIDIHKRKGDLWKITRVSGIENELEIEVLETKIKLSEIYDNVKFE